MLSITNNNTKLVENHSKQLSPIIHRLDPPRSWDIAVYRYVPIVNLEQRSITIILSPKMGALWKHHQFCCHDNHVTFKIFLAPWSQELDINITQNWNTYLDDGAPPGNPCTTAKQPTRTRCWNSNSMMQWSVLQVVLLRVNVEEIRAVHLYSAKGIPPYRDTHV